MRGSTIRSPREVREVPLQRRVLLVAMLGGALAVFAGSSACGTDSVGVDACRRIEKVRCESAPGCGIDLRRMPHAGTTAESDVAACIRYYDDQCLHGLVTKTEPSSKSVDQCVDAIINGDCSIVDKPETHSACAFLTPEPVAASDASTDTATATVVDASADGS